MAQRDNSAGWTVRDFADSLPLPHEYPAGADWPDVLISRLRAIGCKLEADEEGLTVTCRGPLSDWDAQLLRTWGDAARKRMLGLDLV